ncbi:MAG: VWA domain-containing protein [Proteobacteria bacterium]|nr:VWA domain-containing protein [Pseudomonadota bacterium]
MDNLEDKFLDYFEDMLEASEKEAFERALKENASLRKSYDEYVHLLAIENVIAKTSFNLSPNFNIKVMDKVESNNHGFIWRLFMKPRNYKLDFAVSGILATICICTFVLRSYVSLFFGSDFTEVAPSLRKDDSAFYDKSSSNSAHVAVAPATEHKSYSKDNTVSESEAYQDLIIPAPAVQQPVAKGKAQQEISKRELVATAPKKIDRGVDALVGNFEQGSYGNLDEGFYDHDFKAPSYNTNTERYGQYEENPRIKVIQEPVSTFSIDVDTASYTNARRFLAMGQLPPKDSVRIEEFINYFDYNYPKQTEKPFALQYEIAPSALDNGRYLLKLGIKAKDSIGDTNWNLVFLVDVSGSMMDTNKLELVKKGLKLLVNKMKANDSIALVTYAGSSGIALESTKVSEKARILTAIDGLAAGGSTNGAGGIMQAYAVAKSHYLPGSVNRVVLTTDGDFNVGVTNFDDLIRIVEEKRQDGITLTTIGVGSGNINDHLLEQLADKGNGNYFYLDSFQEARKVFEQDISGNMEVVAKDVKLQIEFNPKQVLEYRLIGYDNRKLNKEDFNNDQIDAGEIGSGHTVTALYEIVLANSDFAKTLNQEYRYQENRIAIPQSNLAQGATSELGFLKIRYKAPEAKESVLTEYPIETNRVKTNANEASDDFRFASAVAYFGSVLRESKFKGNYNIAQIIELAEKSKGSDPFGYKQEFINLAKNAASIKK